MINKHQLLKKIIEREIEPEVHRMTNTIYRVGYCSQCGACCKNIDIDSQVSENVADWLKGYGIKIKRHKAEFADPEDESTKTFSVTLSFPISCTHLKLQHYEGNTKVYRCEKYNERPSICRIYPTKQSKWTTCTYTFLNTEELTWFSNEYTKYWEQKNGTKKEIKLS